MPAAETNNDIHINDMSSEMFGPPQKQGWAILRHPNSEKQGIVHASSNSQAGDGGNYTCSWIDKTTKPYFGDLDLLTSGNNERDQLNANHESSRDVLIV